MKTLNVKVTNTALKTESPDVTGTDKEYENYILVKLQSANLVSSSHGQGSS